jgi:hypothetical protein
VVYFIGYVLAFSTDFNFFITAYLADFVTVQNYRIYAGNGFQAHQRYTFISL